MSTGSLHLEQYIEYVRQSVCFNNSRIEGRQCDLHYLFSPPPPVHCMFGESVFDIALFDPFVCVCVCERERERILCLILVL